MKTRLLAIILCLVALLCIGTLTACDEATDCAHSDKEWVEEIPASCTNDGTVAHYVCNECDKTLDADGKEISDLSVPAAHKPVSTWSAADGKHYHACENCDAKFDEAVCSGGTATCTEKAKCSVCNNEYGAEPAHSPESEWSFDDGKHYHKCQSCDAKLDEATCSGGKASCTEKAECSVCHNKYGDVGEHVYSVTKYDDDYHWQQCICEEKNALVPHSYTRTEVTQPTCTEGGYTTYYCECGHSYKDNETSAADHKYDETKWERGDGYHWHASTCGCADQKKDYEKHTLVADVTDPTCTTQGYTVYRCECGYESEPTDFVPENGHSVAVWVETDAVIFDATKCDYLVTYSGDCTVCSGKDTKTDHIPRHSLYEKVVTPATCKSEGQKSKFCSSEECVYHTVAHDTYSYTDSEAHVWGQGRTTDTTTVYKCTLCDATKTQSSGNSASISGSDLKDTSEIELGGGANGNIVIGIDKDIKDKFSDKDISISAGTLDDGQKQAAMDQAQLDPDQKAMLEGCDIFDFTLTADSFDGKLGGMATIRIPYTLKPGENPNSIIVWYIDKGELTPIEAVYAVDANGNGYVTFQTDHFSYYTVDTIDPAEICEKLDKHDAEHQHVVAPTCTTGGYTVCLRCGKQIEGSATPALGHKLNAKVIKEATCSENGIVRHTCADCDLSYEMAIPAVGHYYVVAKQVTATCKNAGSVTYKCTHCSDTYEVTTPKLAHTYHAYVVAPTCNKNGYTEKTCTACGDVVRMSVTAATGHIESTVWYTDKSSHYHICTTCGEKMSESAHLPGPAATEQTAQTCTVCGYTINPPVQHVHSLTKVDAVKPTCTEGGNIEYYVCACGVWFADEAAQKVIADHSSVILDATGHKAQSTNYEKPTCEKEGYTAGVWCDECKTYLRGHVTISAYGHDYHQVVTAPTCTEDGSITYSCEHCGDTEGKATEVIEALGHDYRQVVTAPTCTEEGYTTYSCVRCSHSTKDNITAALGHRYSTAFISDKDGHSHACTRCTETTATEPHIPNYPEATEDHGVKCVKCNYVIAEALEHTHIPKTSVEAVKPTCTESGNIAYYVCRCGEWFADEKCTEIIYNRGSVILKALGHDTQSFGTQAPTCTEKGYTAGVYCKACEQWLSGHEEIAPLGHTPVPGYGENTHWIGCSVCGEKLEENAHDFDKTVTAPTCEEDGYTTYTCDCGHSYVGDKVAALGHAYGEWQEGPMQGMHTRTCSHDASHVETEECKNTVEVIAPTCEEDGYTKHTCESCGHSYTTDTVKALGHDYGDWAYVGNGQHNRICKNDAAHVEIVRCETFVFADIVAPTCEEKGYTKYVCTVCGNYYEDNVTDALGHAYGEWKYDGEGGHVSVCANDPTHIQKQPCQTVSEVVLPTCEKEGYTVHTCTVCGNSYTTDVVAAVGHAYGDWEYVGDGQHQRICKNDATHIENAKCDVKVETVEPTCDGEGRSISTCELCGHSETAIIPALGHKFGDWTHFEDTTQADSHWHERVCENNPEHKDVKPCEMKVEIVEPTCEEGGYTKNYCDVCGYSYIVNEVPAYGHNYGEWKYDGEGRHVRVCENNHEHTMYMPCAFNANVFEPDCTNGGYTEYICTVSGHSYIADEVEPLGHNYVDGRCDRCGRGEDDVDEGYRTAIHRELSNKRTAIQQTMKLTAEQSKELTTLLSTIKSTSSAKELEATIEAFNAKINELLSTADELTQKKYEALATILIRWNEFRAELPTASTYQTEFNELRNQIRNAENEETVLAALAAYGELEERVRAESAIIEQHRENVLEAMRQRWEKFVSTYDYEDYQLQEYNNRLNLVANAKTVEQIDTNYDAFMSWMNEQEANSTPSVDEEYRQQILNDMRAAMDNIKINNWSFTDEQWSYLNLLRSDAKTAKSNDELESLWSKFKATVEKIEKQNQGDSEVENHRQSILEQMNNRYNQIALNGWDVDEVTKEILNQFIVNVNTAATVKEIDSIWNEFDMMMTSIEQYNSVDPAYRQNILEKMNNRWNEYAQVHGNQYNDQFYYNWYNRVMNAQSVEEIQSLYSGFKTWVNELENSEPIDEKYRSELIDKMNARLKAADSNGIIISKENRTYLNDLIVNVQKATTMNEIDSLWQKFDMKMTEIEKMAGDDDFNQALTKAKAESLNIYRALSQGMLLTSEQRKELSTLRSAVNSATSYEVLDAAMNALKAFAQKIVAESEDDLAAIRYELLIHIFNKSDKATELGYKLPDLTHFTTITKNALSEEELTAILIEFEDYVESFTGGALVSELNRINALEEMTQEWNNLIAQYPVSEFYAEKAQMLITSVENAVSAEEVSQAWDEMMRMISQIRLENGAVDEVLRADTRKNMNSRWNRLIKMYEVEEPIHAKYMDYCNAVDMASSNDEINKLFNEFIEWIDRVESHLKEQDPNLDEAYRKDILGKMWDRYQTYANQHGNNDTQATFYEYLTGVQQAMTNDEIDKFYQGFNQWMDSLEKGDPELENHRQLCLEEISARWKNYTANNKYTDEQYEEYRNWRNRIKNATDYKELDMIMSDFNTWIKELESGYYPDEPSVEVSNFYFEVGVLEATVGDEVEPLIEKYLVGKYFVIKFTNGTEQRIAVTRDMITTNSGDNIFHSAGTHHFDIFVTLDGCGYHAAVRIEISPNMDGATVIGEYTVDSSTPGVTGEWKVVLYDNGFADLVIVGDGSELAPYRIENDLLYLTSAGNDMIMVMHEDTKTVTFYNPKGELNLIGTYHYYDTMIHVYGDYHGPDNYIAVFTMMGDGGQPYYLTLTVMLDLDNRILSGGVFGGELYFDDEGNLSDRNPSEECMHEFVSDKVDSTCTTEGYAREYCIHCGMTVRDEILPLLPHAIGENGTCINCGWSVGGDYSPVREELLMRMEKEWYQLVDELKGDVPPHLWERYEELVRLMRGEQNEDVMVSLYKYDFCNLLQELRDYHGNADYFMHAYLEQRYFELEANHGLDIHSFIEKYVIGTNLCVEYSQSGVTMIPIEWSMIQYDKDMDISGHGTYRIRVTYGNGDFWTDQSVEINVLMDMSSTKLIGTYVCDMSCMDEDTAILEIYDNGYAIVTFEGSDYREFYPCHVENGMIFWDTDGDGVYVFVIKDDNTAEMYDGFKYGDPVISEFRIDDEDMTITVFGEYNGKGTYLARFSERYSDGEYWMTMLVEFDLENRVIYCEMFGDEPLYFDENGNYIDPDGDECQHNEVMCGQSQSTCTQHGHITEICAKCGMVLRDELLPLLSHAVDVNGVCMNCGLVVGGNVGGDENSDLREELLNRMREDWNMLIREMNGKIELRYQMRYDEIVNRIMMTNDSQFMTDLYKYDFCNLLEEVRNYYGSADRFVRAYLEQEYIELPGGHGYEMRDFIEKYIIGTNLYIEYSQSGVKAIPITWDMISYDECADISCHGEYYIWINYGEGNFWTQHSIELTVLMDMTGVTHIGTYTCDLSSMGEDTVALFEIYDNGYARVSFDGGESYDYQNCYVEGDKVLWGMNGEIVLVIKDEKTLEMYDLTESGEAIIGEYRLDERYLGVTVFGEYTGAGRYFARLFDTSGDGYWLTMTVYLDLENSMIASEFLDSNPVTIGEDGRLILPKYEEDQPNDEEVIMPDYDQPVVDNENNGSYDDSYDTEIDYVKPGEGSYNDSYVTPGDGSYNGSYVIPDGDFGYIQIENGVNGNYVAYRAV